MSSKKTVQNIDVEEVKDKILSILFLRFPYM